MGILKESINGTIIEVDIQSTNLTKVVYDTSNKKLTTTFKTGNIYEYDEVPWDLFTKFRLAESQGSFFSKEIAKKFTYRKLQ